MPGTPPPRYAYLGPAGTFSEAALRTLPAAATAELISYPSVPDALDAVRTGDVAAAVVPLENSVEGSVATTLDELATGDPVVISRELLLPVSFALLARPGTKLEDVKTVTTIPHAEAQVRGWLRRTLPSAQFIPAASTADGARAVAAGEADAAVAAPIAAQHYRLEIVAHDIHDVDGAVTRFVLVVPPGSPPPAPTGADRTTLVAYIADDHPGALLEILTEFAVRGVNLTRIESRPTGQGIGRYYFSVDCEGHIGDARVGEALSALRRICDDVRFLGSYERADGTTPALRRGTTDEDFTDASAWLTRLREGGSS
ncbi:MAG: prephenate dehydratase [Frankiales bacterium]|jgi:prephenate dehydratase|nr:prephenate dehydratase [Frankiales bacterium]